MEVLSDYLISGIVFSLTIVFGLWLSKLGKPYHGTLFNVHKLLALGAVIAAGIQAAGMFQIVVVQTMLVVLWIVAVLSVIALFVSGALLSLDKLGYNTMRTIHRIGLGVLVVASVFAVYLVV